MGYGAYFRPKKHMAHSFVWNTNVLCAKTICSEGEQNKWTHTQFNKIGERGSVRYKNEKRARAHLHVNLSAHIRSCINLLSTYKVYKYSIINFSRLLLALSLAINHCEQYCTYSAEKENFFFAQVKSLSLARSLARYGSSTNIQNSKGFY